MEIQNLTERVQAPGEKEIGAMFKRPLWREMLMRRSGKVVLAICPNGRGPCADTRCGLQPVCSCARTDLAEARKLETRVWLTVAFCGAIALIIVFIRGSMH